LTDERTERDERDDVKATTTKKKGALL